jgi:hypothetical protein
VRCQAAQNSIYPCCLSVTTVCWSLWISTGTLGMLRQCPSVSDGGLLVAADLERRAGHAALVSICQVVGTAVILERDAIGWLFSHDKEVVSLVSVVAPWLALVLVFDALNGTFAGEDVTTAPRASVVPPHQIGARRPLAHHGNEDLV